MKNINAKNFVLLFAPLIFLLIFGSLWDTKRFRRVPKPVPKPRLHLKSVEVKPATYYPSNVRAAMSKKGMSKKSFIQVNVVVEYLDPARLSKQKQIRLKDPCEFYVEDAHGVKYGMPEPRFDDGVRIYPRFLDKEVAASTSKRFLSEDSWELGFYVPLYQIPKSAGKLTLKTTFIHKSTSGRSDLPLAIVVRE